MDQPLVHKFSSASPQFPSRPAVLVVAIAAAILILGLLSGFLLSRRPLSAGDTTGMVQSATEIGSLDTKTFRDSATGTIEAGGLNGDGTHKLVREGGPSQTVYLVSSVVDLNEFVGKKVEIWGETVKAKNAPWLMDVGRVKILE